MINFSQPSPGLAQPSPDLSPSAGQTSRFCKDVLAGLIATPKYLSSKYFYDKIGDRLFQQIMRTPEYYLFECEREIFRTHIGRLAGLMTEPGTDFHLIELGAGDGSKSVGLLEHLTEAGARFTYTPIDISPNMISYLETWLPATVPGLKTNGLAGEFFPMLQKLPSADRKVVLFLGSTLGNMSPGEARKFCRELRSHLRAGDMALIGLDLKKNPDIILAAYNDKTGITKQFNLNLLVRINRELGADFDPANFDHFPMYDPLSGACNSYLVSRTEQVVRIQCNGGTKPIQFERNEEIFMEISQKYTIRQIDYLANQASFATVQHFYDSRQWFVDALWLAV